MTSTGIPGSAPPPRSKARQVAVGEDLAGLRVDKALSKCLPEVPRTRLFRLIRKGEVRVNGKRTSIEVRLVAGDVLRIPPVREAEAGGGGQRVAPGKRVPPALIEAIERSIIHEDARLLAIDKPAGLAVHGGSGLSFGVIEALRASRPDETLELAHRLDRDTSGVLLISRKPAALRTLHALLREGEVQKGYLALVIGNWQLGHKTVDAPLLTHTRVGGERTVRVGAGGKESRTEFRLVQHYGRQASLLEVELHTGRTHQIRVHATHCGHPVAGDEKYGDAEANERLAQLGLRRLFLHAHRCHLDWPGGGELSLSAPLPPELKSVLDKLGAAKGAGDSARRR